VKIDDVLYFAPNIRFDELDFDGPRLPGQFAARIAGFYLEPADHCIEKRFALAAGVLLTACIDALARVQTGSSDVGKRFMFFARTQLPSFATDTMARRLYTEFRNGLIHEARIKRGAQFSFDFEETAWESNGILVINPARLASEVKQAFARYINYLEQSVVALEELSCTLKADHAEDR
jgi:hypothetical protein